MRAVLLLCCLFVRLSLCSPRICVACVRCVCSTEGKNISPTIVLNYMLRSAKKQNKHLPLAQAITYLNSKAPGVSISDQFMLQLAAVENELYDEVSVKVKGFSRSGIGGGHHGSRVGVGRGGRGGRGGKGKRGK